MFFSFINFLPSFPSIYSVFLFILWTIIIVKNVKKKNFIWIIIGIFFTGILWGVLCVIITNLIIKENEKNEENEENEKNEDNSEEQ